MSWRMMRSNLLKARADAPNGFSLSKRRAAKAKECLPQDVRNLRRYRHNMGAWTREIRYAMGRHNAEMTMNVYTKPAVIHIPLDQLVTKTWTEGRRHYTEIRDREGHLVKREYKDFQ